MNETPQMVGMAYGQTANLNLNNPNLFWAQQNLGLQGALNQRGLLDEYRKMPQYEITTTETKPMSTRRIVRVIIMDPNENIPMDKAVLFDSDERFTDLTDQELFFESPIMEKLKTHNELRKTTKDKADSREAGKDIFLEEAKIRDLKMVVITVAQF